MKKIFTCLLVAALPWVVQAQSGELDPSFNGNGIVIGNYSDANNSADAMAIQSDGKIVVSGATGVAGEIQIGVSRFNTDGSLDTTFGNEGKLVTTSGWIKSFILDMKIQPDGKIVMAGYRWNNSTGDIIVIRLNEDGSMDSTFGTDGLAIVDSGETEVSESFALLDDGKFLISGYINDSFSLVKLNNDGSIDTDFGTEGWVLTDFGDSLSFAYDINAQEADGKIVLAGASINNSNKWAYAMARYNADGTLDNTFGTNGLKEFNVGVDNDFALGVLQLENGKILVGGHSWFDTQPLRYEIAVAQLNNDGSLDTEYGNEGVFKGRWAANGENYFADMALQPDGKLVVTGRANQGSAYNFGVMRINENGQLDSGFGENGIVVTPIDLNDSKSVNIAIQTDGKIVVSGDTAKPSENVDFFIARYLNENLAVQDMNSSDIKLYPNPAKNQINIEWTNSSKEQKIEIFNLLGQKVLTSTIANKGNIDISSLAVGTYFVKMNDKGNVKTLRFIKK